MAKQTDLKRGYRPTVHKLTPEERTERMEEKLSKKELALANKGEPNRAEYKRMASMFAIPKTNSEYTAEVVTKMCCEYLDFCGESNLQPNFNGLAVYMGVKSDRLTLWRQDLKNIERAEVLERFNDFVVDNYKQRIEEHTASNMFLLKASGVTEIQRINITNDNQPTKEELDDQIRNLGIE